MVVAFAALGTVTQLMWVTFAPVSVAASRHYGVSEAAIGWLANVFPLLYVLLAIPAGMALDRWFRGGLAAGGVLVAGGALLRLAGDSYGWVLVGQLVVAVGQPLVLNAITGLASRYLAERDRPAGIAIGSASTFAGLIVGFGLGAAFADPAGIRTLVQIQAVLAVLAAVAVFTALRTPAEHRTQRAPTGLAALRTAWSDSYIRRLCGLVFVPFGVFVALSTFAQPLLAPAGVPEATAGLILVANVVAGVVGCAVVPIWASRHRGEIRIMHIALLVTAAACAVLAVVPGVVTGFAAITVLGFALLPALPIVLELTERRAGSTEGTAAGLIWLAGNLGGLLVAAVVGLLLDAPLAAFLLLALLSVVTLPVLRSFRQYAETSV
jgi:predicted MFS family arabinose efflux permease